MSIVKELNFPINREAMSFDEHIKDSKIIAASPPVSFDYKLNDKTTKSKLVKAAKRDPLELEVNSTSSNLVFSAGAWYHHVLPSVKYWEQIQGEKSCRIGDYEIKVGGVKFERETAGKIVNSKVIFYAGRDKIVCHLYNTTQLILVNGHGYQKFIDLFLKPYFVSKIEETPDEIKSLNEEVIKQLGPNTVKRSNIRYKKGEAFPCNNCDFAAKSIATLRKHRKNEHEQSFNSSKKSLSQMESTRNNSIVERLMIEDVTITGLSGDDQPVEEVPLKYTCFECKYTTKSKQSIDEHVKLNHGPELTEEVRFICKVCDHAFGELENYEIHEKTHGTVQNNDDQDLDDLSKRILVQILESFEIELQEAQEDKNFSFLEEFNIKCEQCKFSTGDQTELKTHMQLLHKTPKVKIVPSKLRCTKCEYECNLNIQMKKHIKKIHVGSEKEPNYFCNLCDFTTNFVDQLWNHKLEEHGDKYFNHNNFTENDRKNILFSVVAEQNVELMEEMVTLRKFLKEVFEQLTNDIEDHINSGVRESNEKHLETKNAMVILAKEIVSLKEETKAEQTKKEQSSPIKTPTQSSSSSKKSAEKSFSSLGPSPGVAPKTPRSSNIKHKTYYQKKPRVLVVGDSQNLNFRKIEEITNTTVNTAKGYSSSFDNKSRSKSQNMNVVTKTALKDGKFDRLVLSVPSEDITNIPTDKTKPDDNVDDLKEIVKESCKNMMQVAESALNEHPELKQVTILTHAPRHDSKASDPLGLKPKLAVFANSYLSELWLSSKEKKSIAIGSHTLDCPTDIAMIRHTDEHTGRFDGVNYYSAVGRAAYLESVMNILLTAFNTQPSQSTSKDDHTECPQARYQRTQTYSSVVKNQQPIKIQNRFSPLRQVQGNW